MNRIDHKFTTLRKSGKKAFIAFITAGYPSLAATEKLLLGLEQAGADIVELGVPFSDPMADGPVIQEASQYALKKGTRLVDILNMVKKARRKTNLPVCLMTYYNPIFCFGEKEFVKKAKDCGVDGVIVPDLPPEEAASLSRLTKKSQVDLISFIAPTTSDARIKYIAKAARGFIYYVSLTGVTGARSQLPAELLNNLKKVKKLAKKPVCVGFGVSTSAQVRKLSSIADGVIVGSAIVRKIKENLNKPDMIKRVSSFTRSLKG